MVLPFDSIFSVPSIALSIKGKGYGEKFSIQRRRIVAKGSSFVRSRTSKLKRRRPFTTSISVTLAGLPVYLITQTRQYIIDKNSRTSTTTRPAHSATLSSFIPIPSQCLTSTIPKIKCPSIQISDHHPLRRISTAPLRQITSASSRISQHIRHHRRAASTPHTSSHHPPPPATSTQDHQQPLQPPSNPPSRPPSPYITSVYRAVQKDANYAVFPIYPRNAPPITYAHSYELYVPLKLEYYDPQDADAVRCYAQRRGWPGVMTAAQFEVLVAAPEGSLTGFPIVGGERRREVREWLVREVVPVERGGGNTGDGDGGGEGGRRGRWSFEPSGEEVDGWSGERWSAGWLGRVETIREE